MKPKRVRSLADRKRIGALVLFGTVLLAVLAIKAINDNWFEPRRPLELNGKPALVFFMLGEGCECQMKVVRAAETQMARWEVPDERGVPVLRVDISRRPDLAEQYEVIRAPALVLLNDQGQVVWKQDDGLSDEAPLDLTTCQARMTILGQDP